MNSTVPSKSESAEPLPPIPAKRYFTIGEVSELCGVKPHVLRYWEQEFTQLRPMKRRGNRRYYQHHEVLLVRRIRDLLYEQGFTISGARNRLGEAAQNSRRRDSSSADNLSDGAELDLQPSGADSGELAATGQSVDIAALRADLLAALALLQIDSGRQG
jgi:hypothetical protein